MKSFLKKLSLLLVFFVFSCESINKNLELVTDEMYSPKPVQTKNQFESANLATQKANAQKVRVALFLPFSGKNKELGWHLFNSAVLSLFDNDVNHNIELVLFDSKDNNKDTTKTFQEIVDKGIKVVIGPVFSQSIEAIEEQALSNKITVISLSNNRQLMSKTDNNGGIFLSGVMPENQIDRIVGYAMDKGKLNFAIIAPDNQYGLTINGIYKNIVKRRDGNFIASELYQPNGKDIEKAVERLVNDFNVPSHLAEGGGNKLKKNATIKESDRLYPQVIMIPESGKNMSIIADMIKKYNKDERDFQLIGTNQWDDISTLNDQNVIGAWFAAPENYRFRAFEKTYYQTFNKFPPRISSIVYDSVAATSELIDRKGGKAPVIKDFTAYASSSKNGFSGIDGLFRFLPNGLVQRNLAVLKVGSGQFETIDKPLEVFLKY